MWAHVFAALLTTPFAAATLASRRKSRARTLADCEATLAQTEHERQVLELIARGKPYKDVFDAVGHGVERLTGDCYCVIFYLDKEEQCLVEASRVQLPAGPKFSEPRLALQPNTCVSSSCAASNKTIIVSDMLAPDLSAEVREFAKTYDVRSCWCLPIPDFEGNVAGVLAVYSRLGDHPSERQMDIAGSGVRLAGIAIQRMISDQKLQRYLHTVKLAEKAATFGIWEMDLVTGIVKGSEAWAALERVADANAGMHVDMVRQVVHPDDRPLLGEGSDRAFATGEPYLVDFRIVPDALTLAIPDPV